MKKVIFIRNMRHSLFVLFIMMLFVLFVFMYCFEIALFLRLDLLVPFFELSLFGLHHI